MAKVEISVPGERIVEEFTALVPQPTVPSTARSPDIGLVEVSQVNPTELVPGPPGPPGPRGSRWTTGDGDPSSTTGNVLGDMYLDDVTGDIWTWNGSVWVNTGTNLTPSPPIMLEQIKTVDGSGSGLDADLLDGQDGNWYRDRVNHTGEQPISTVTGLQPALDLKAPIASPLFTGDPRAPTPATSDNDTSVATTAYVKANIAGVSQFPEAPNDGLTYGRKNLAWATIVGGAVVSDTAPGAPLQNGQLWYETDTGNTYVWVTDSDSSQWVQQNVMPSGGAGDNLSTAADMSIGFRTGGNRFVVNDKADMSGTDVMTVGETGVVTAGGTITSSGSFTSSGANVFLNAQGGLVHLRPTVGSTTGQTTIDSAGAMSVAGALTASGSITSTAGQVTAGGGYFIGSPTWAIMGPAAGGTPSGIVLRPTAYNSTTGETLISPAGTITTGANIVVNGSINSTGIYGVTPAATMVFRPNGSSNATGQATIATSGMATFVAVNAPGSITSDSYVAGGTFAGSAFANSGNGVLNRNDGCCIHKSSGTAAFSAAAFFNNATIGVSGGAQVGAITTTGSSTAYVTSSDELLKDFIGVYDPQKAIDIIRADPVRDFNWKNGDGYAVGWGAQTSHAVSPDLAQPPPEPSPAEIEALEGKEPPKAGEEGYVPWGMDQSKRTPYLWAALTNALDRIDQLEARLAALEGGA